MARLPSGSTTVIVRGSNYHYHGGWFYSRRGSSYVVVRSPYGARVRRVPNGCTVIVVRRRNYYYYGGTYYRYYPSQTYYEVVEAPADAIVPDLPEGAEQVEIDGVIYYKYEDVLYKPIYVEGILQYKVIEL